MHPIVGIASWFVLLAPFVLLSVDITTAADNLEKQTTLNIIADFANRICGTVPQTGTSGIVELSGKAKAELSGLLKNLASIGIEGVAQYQVSPWEGILQGQLAEQLNKSRDCKKEVFIILQAKLLDIASPPSDVPPIDRPTPTPSPPTTAPTGPLCPVLFSDDFDNGIGNEWTRAGEGFHMANGQLTHSGPRGTLWLRTRDWTNVVVDVDVREAGCGGDYVAILLRMQDTSNYIGVVITTGGCLFATGGIYLIKNGQQTTLVQGQGSPGHWRIEVVGRLYRVFVGGQLFMSASDDTVQPFTRGSVGIAMGGGRLDNFTVCGESR